LYPMLVEALKNGIQVESHAIGDRANRTIINLYEKAFKEVPAGQRKVKEPRWRIEHAQIVHPDDIPRFAKLGIIPSMQPSHAIGDLHFAPSRLGMKRLEGAYAWESFIKSGCKIAGGSDAPVERGEPMIEFYAAVSRKDMKGFTGEGWHPEQAVSRQQALKMFTLWAANAAFEENIKGSIEVGKLADLTVLSADIMKIAEPEILKTRCVMTVIGGEVVFDASKQTSPTSTSQTGAAKLSNDAAPIGAPVSVSAPPSAGPGAGGGVGSGTGVGTGIGPGSNSSNFYPDGSARRVDSRPVALTRPRPHYPDGASGNGVVRLRALVGADGTVKIVRIASSSGEAFNWEARQAVSKMTFKPAMKDGLPVPYWVVLEVTFNLR
jgi:TonB family protein